MNWFDVRLWLGENAHNCDSSDYRLLEQTYINHFGVSPLFVSSDVYSCDVSHFVNVYNKKEYVTLPIPPKTASI